MQRPILTTSWDDGHPSDLRVAELLGKYGLPGTFYVPLSAPRGVLSKAGVCAIGSRFEIGAHTRNHVILTSVADTVAIREIADPKSSLEDVTGRPCRVFCFPQGKFAQRHMAMVRAAGFLGARTVELLSIEFPRVQNGVALIPTTLQAHSQPPSRVLRNLAKRLRWRSLLRWARRPSAGWPSGLRYYAEAAIRNGGVLHLWGHSWEIDEFNDWLNLDSAFRYLAEIRSEFRTLTNGDLCLTPRALPKT